MTVYLISTTCIVCCIVTTIWLYRTMKKQVNYMEIVINAIYAQLQMLRFLGDAEASNLWKIRQEIYNWQCQWTTMEEYEIAQQAKIMVAHIENLIKIHENIINKYEDNERTNG